MPRIYTRVRRPVHRSVNPLLLPPAAVPEPEPAPPVTEVEVAVLPSTDMTLRELQGLAEDAGLPTYGTKADLVARLNDE